MYSICHTYNSHMYIHTRSFGRGVFTRGPSGRMLEKFSILRGTTTFNAPVMKLSGCDCIGAKLITWLTDSWVKFKKMLRDSTTYTSTTLYLTWKEILQGFYKQLIFKIIFIISDHKHGCTSVTSSHYPMICLKMY